ncbi:hypothetical protein C5S35_02275 [Candidatus Methanophagaceae archaeon]|nr:hypothetical protein C5S35_02275 [Methanophagales archaeon]
MSKEEIKGFKKNLKQEQEDFENGTIISSGTPTSKVRES